MTRSAPPPGPGPAAAPASPLAPADPAPSSQPPAGGPNRPGRPPLLGVVGMVAGARAYSYALRIVSGFVRPLLLSPELFGLWNLFALLLQYATFYLHLGCLQAMRFRLPYEWGRGNDAQGERIKGAVWLGSLVPHLLVAGATGLLALLPHWDAPTRWGLVTVALLVAMIWYRNWMVQILQARQTFGPISAMEYLTASLGLALSIPLILWIGIYGVYISALVTEAATLAFLRHHCREPVAEPFGWRMYWSLTRQGFPIMTFDMASMLVRSADRLLIAGLLGTEQLGYYALAAFIFGTLLEIPGVVREVLEPRLMQDLSGLDDQTVLETYLFRPLLNTAHYLPFLIGPAVFAAPFIDVILPRYAAGVVPAQVLALGGYFLAITFVVRGIIVANAWQGRALGPIMTTALVNLVVSAGAIKLGGGIVAVAAVSAASYALLLGLLLGLVARHHPTRGAAWGRTLVGVISPFVVMSAALALLLWGQAALEINRWLAVVIQLGLFGAVMVGFIALSRRLHPQVAACTPAPLWRRLRHRRG